MLAYVEGRALQRTENSCLLLTQGGVGYEIFLPEHTLAKLPALGESCAFYTSFIVREDAQELFGFSSWDERQTFNLLTGISRVGARTALAILSTYRPNDLRRIVAEDNAAALTHVSGIGKKTAQQIFLELKYKLKGSAQIVPAESLGKAALVYRDALTGLANLGYDEETAAQALKKVLAEHADLDVGEALRASLKALAKGKK